MITASIKAEQYDAYMSRVTKVRDNIVAGNIYDPTIESILSLGEEVAKSIVPVKTGHLRDSIHYEIIGRNEGTLFADADYAGEINFGNSHRVEKPYFTIAVATMIQQYPQIVKIDTDLIMQGKDPAAHKLTARGTPVGHYGAELARFKHHQYVGVTRSAKTGRKKYLYARGFRAGSKHIRMRQLTRYGKRLGYRA